MILQPKFELLMIEKIIRRRLCLRTFYRSKSTSGGHPLAASAGEVGSQRRIRNVGLIAHIDAGKTTTTERMLFVAGRTRTLGDVNRGDTVTDFLEEERERGISIMSATASLAWRRHDIHLIDTPGHVDFTLEVQRSLSVVDGALIIIDACKGVETQTRTVWKQANRHNLPRIIFVNKMDRPAASFPRSLASLRQRFGSPQRAFFPIQSPVFSSALDGPRFLGLVDLPSLTLKTWPMSISRGIEAAKFTCTDIHSFLTEGTECGQVSETNLRWSEVVTDALKAREQLIGILAELDEEFAEEYLTLEKPELIVPADRVTACIQRLTKSGRGVPVLLGSCKQNIGIQPVLDAIIDYLPDPSQHLPPPIITNFLRRVRSLRASSSKNHSDSALHNLPILLVFKILFDSQLGPLTLARIYSGSVTCGTHLSNWSQQDETGVFSEKVTRVLQLNGDSYDSLNSASTGYIIAIPGLVSTRTGDVLGPVQNLQNDAEVESDDFTEFVVPTPVVHAALEPRSGSAIRNLERALTCMQREDSSFTANYNSETGQWVIGGMGDLHLEVVLSRLQREYKVEVAMGPLLTVYHEMPNHEFNRTTSTRVSTGQSIVFGLVGGRQRIIRAVVAVTASGQPHASERPQIVFEKDWTTNTISVTPDPRNTSSVWKKTIAGIRQACEFALATGGPLMRSRVVNVCVHIKSVCEVSNTASAGASNVDEIDSRDLIGLRVPSTPGQLLTSFLTLLRSAVTKAVLGALHDIPEWRILEPVMAVEILLPLDDDSPQDASVAPFIGELSRRRAEVESIEAAVTASENSSGSLGGQKDCLVRAFAPLSELSGFSAAVRSLSSGRAEISLRLADYRPVSSERQNELLLGLSKRIAFRSPSTSSLTPDSPDRFD